MKVDNFIPFTPRSITLICVGLISTISDSFSCVRCRRSRASLILFPNHILFIVCLPFCLCSKTVHPHQTDGRFFIIVGSQSLFFKVMDLLSKNRTLYHKSCHQVNTKDDKQNGTIMQREGIIRNQIHRISLPCSTSTVTVLPGRRSPCSSLRLSIVSTVCCTYRRRGRAPNSGS